MSSIQSSKLKNSTSDLIPIKKFQGHRNKVRSLAWNSDGRRLASGGVDSSVRLWQPERDSKINIELKGHTGDISCIKWNPINSETLASCSSTLGSNPDKSVYFWDLRVSGPTGKVETSGDSITMTWSPDGKTIVVGSRTDVITWIDADTRKVIKEVKNSVETNEALFSHSGNLLLTTMYGKISINSFPSSIPILDVSISPCAITTLDLDSTGKYMVCGSTDTVITLWETSEWTCLKSAGYHDAPVRVVGFSHDGSKIASTSGDSKITIAEIPTLKKKHTISTGGNCNVLAWHPTKDLLAFAGDETENGRPTGVFKIWGL